MARLHVMERSEAQAVMDGLHEALGKRLAVSSLCPVHGGVHRLPTSPCVRRRAAASALPVAWVSGPCRTCSTIVLENRADEHTLDLIERTARTIYLSADCAIGYEAGEMALTAIRGFHDDFEHHSGCMPAVSRRASSYHASRDALPAWTFPDTSVSWRRAATPTRSVLIRKDNPLPAVCGLICEHPCEMHCRRGMVDDPMNIRGLKRYAVEHMESDYTPRKAKATGKRVAVIGGGPAGLSAAYYLALMGHTPTIFEQRKQLGGMLRYGIPSYRLPREDLDREIQWLLDCGIEVNTETRIDADFGRLREDYDAVYMAIGAHSDHKLGLPGEDNPGVMSAVDMLRSIGDDEYPDFTGKRVCVIGGGNVAMDVARSAVRCHAKSVTIIYRRRIEDMTAQDEEIVGAQAEGCEILQLCAPVSIDVCDDGSVGGVRVQRQIIGGAQEGDVLRHGTPRRRRPSSQARSSSSPLARQSILPPSMSRAFPPSGDVSSPIPTERSPASMASSPVAIARPAPRRSFAPSTPARSQRRTSTATLAMTTR